MNRTDSLKVINAFIAELGAPPAPAAPPAASKKETPLASAPVMPVADRPAPANVAQVPAQQPRQPKGGLDSLMAGCAGFEIGSAAPGAAETPSKGGLDSLIQGCGGFEVGASPAAEFVPQPEPVAVAATVPATPCEPAQAETSPQVSPPAVEVAPETAAARKAVANLSNKPLLLSLLQYYASESQRSNPSRSMLKTTKEQVMKNWPMLALSPLIAALDGAAS